MINMFVIMVENNKNNRPFSMVTKSFRRCRRIMSDWWYIFFEQTDLDSSLSDSKLPAADVTGLCRHSSIIAITLSLQENAARS